MNEGELISFLKKITGGESLEAIIKLTNALQEHGYHVTSTRGDSLMS